VSGLAYAGWALLAAAGVLLWASSHARGVVTARPLEVLTRLCAGPVVRVALVAGVMWVGWHLFAR
jgi:hypothetical protein